MRKTVVKSAEGESAAAFKKQQLKDWNEKRRLEREAYRDWLAYKDKFKEWLEWIELRKNGRLTSEDGTKLLPGALKRPANKGNLGVSKEFSDAARLIIDEIESNPASALVFSTLLASRNIKIPVVPLSNDRSDHQKAGHETDIPRWRDRKPGINAAQFIRENYGELDGQNWRSCGVTRPDLKSNPGLYGAYTAWIEDHPEDKLEFTPGGGKPSGRPRKSDTYEKSLERARERKKKERQPAAPR